MNDRRARGLCIVCDEKYTLGHHLKHKKSQLLMLEVEEDEDQSHSVSEGDSEEGSEEKVQISLNALMGLTCYQTLRVKGLCGKKVVYILLDSGSNHNFVSADIAGDCWRFRLAFTSCKWN